MSALRIDDKGSRNVVKGLHCSNVAFMLVLSGNVGFLFEFKICFAFKLDKGLFC